MRYLSLLCSVFLACASCAGPGTVAPIKESNAKTRASIHETRTEIRHVVGSVKEGREILVKLIPSLTPEQQEQARIVELRLNDAIKSAEQADLRAQEAEKHAELTDKRADNLAKTIGKYQKFWDQGHAMWGLGAIILGVSILFSHLFIGLAIIAALVIALMIFAPGAIPAIVGAVRKFFSLVFGRK